MMNRCRKGIGSVQWRVCHLLGVFFAILSPFVAAAQNLPPEDPEEYFGELHYRCFGPKSIFGTAPITSAGEVEGEPRYSGFVSETDSDGSFALIVVVVADAPGFSERYYRLCFANAFSRDASMDEPRTTTFESEECSILLADKAVFKTEGGTLGGGGFNNVMSCEFWVKRTRLGK
ncbi:hypothetical protein MRY87_12805 [bacterium]|nr:hypothetical protein [bacterium]